MQGLDAFETACFDRMVASATVQHLLGRISSTLSSSPAATNAGTAVPDRVVYITQPDVAC